MPRSARQTLPLQPVEALRLDNQLCFALYVATNRLTRLYQPLLAELGITYPQYLVLMMLWEWEGEHRSVSVGAIGQALDLDSGTLTPLLKRMETAGLVQRQRDPADERRVLVSLTDAGWRLRERAERVPAAMAGRIPMARAEADALRAQLKHFQQLLALAAE